MRLMLRTEKPQLPPQTEEAAGVQQVLMKTRGTFGNLQVLCKNSQEWGDQEAGAQIYIYRTYLDTYLFYFRILTALPENKVLTTRTCMCIRHFNYQYLLLSFRKGYTMSKCGKEEQGIVTGAACISWNNTAWSLGLLASGAR